MRRTLHSAIVAAALVLSGAALGQPSSNEQGSPRFTLAEEIIIARNDALNELLAVDPWSVRKIMDAMLASKQGAPTKEPAAKAERRRDAGAVVIDPQRNPDLEVFQRASPEAAYDLFQLLKRVASGQSGPK